MAGALALVVAGAALAQDPVTGARAGRASETALYHAVFDQAVLSRSADTARTVTIDDGDTRRLAKRLPWGYSVPRGEEETGPDDPPFIHAHPVTWADGPLTFDREARTFVGTVSFVLEDSMSPGATLPVDPPMAIGLSSDADSLERTLIELDRTGLPAETVRITAGHPGDSVRLEIRTPADVHAVVLSVPVRPTVVIETLPGRVPGWGLGEYLVTVEVHGAAPEEDVRLHVSVPGVVDSAGLRMGRARATRLSIRSAGLGRAPLRVSAPGLVADEVVYTYVLPVRFFGFGLLGALTGATLGLAPSGRRRRWPSFLGRVGIGLAAVLAYYALGVRASGGALPTSEVAVLAVALLAAAVTPDLFGRHGAQSPRPPG